MPTQATTLKYRTSRYSGSGMNVTPSSTAWQFGNYGLLDANLTTDIALSGLSFQFNNVVAGSTTVEILIEIAKVPSGSFSTADAVLIAQIPVSVRCDTAAGHYSEGAITTVYFPELIMVRANNGIAIRAATSAGSATTMTGFKIFFQSDLDISAPNEYQENYRRVRTPDGISSSIAGTM